MDSGAIVGALGTSLVLIAAVGTQNGERILVALSALAAAITLIPALVLRRNAPKLTVRDAIWTLAIVELGLIVGRNVDAIPPLLAGHSRFSAAQSTERAAHRSDRKRTVDVVIVCVSHEAVPAFLHFKPWDESTAARK